MEYRAVTVKDQEALPYTRPMKAIFLDDHWSVRDPLTGAWKDYPRDSIFELGGWTDRSTFRLGNDLVTWEAYSAHVTGQILKQHAIVDRLAEEGIVRFRKEPYVNRNGTFLYDFRLTYDELDTLLGMSESDLS